MTIGISRDRWIAGACSAGALLLVFANGAHTRAAGGDVRVKTFDLNAAGNDLPAHAEEIETAVNSWLSGQPGIRPERLQLLQGGNLPYADALSIWYRQAGTRRSAARLKLVYGPGGFPEADAEANAILTALPDVVAISQHRGYAGSFDLAVLYEP